MAEVDSAARKNRHCHTRQESCTSQTTQPTDRMAPLKVLAKAASELTHATAPDSQDKILLAMAAHMPTKRADLGALRIVYSMPRISQQGNFIVLSSCSQSTDSATLVMDHYRTSQLYGRHVERLPAQVSKLVHESLAKWPRPYLFCVKIGKERGRPLTNAAYSKRFYEVIMRRTGHNTNIQLTRKAFIRERANAAECTVECCEAIARSMMHSLLQQRMFANAIPKVVCQ
jgi:hypothetical protein